MSRKLILILDPDRDTNELFARALETYRDCKCYTSMNEQEALDLVKEIVFDIVLGDMAMLMAGDYGLLRKFKQIAPNTMIVVHAFLHQKQMISRALSLGVYDYIIKPIKVEVFRKKVDEFCLSLPA